jgi:antitoxin (DNA-binding transcriptional repressor) of toxin-antitoxin stability system
MEHRITTLELASSLDAVLARVQRDRDSFAIEDSGTTVARVVPAPRPGMTLREFVTVWRETMGPPDPEFADALESVNRADRPSEDPWDS